VLALNSGLVFASGDARIQTEWEGVLNSMLEVLEPFSDKYLFAVEGHTDDQPVLANGRYPSNWELSTARAIAVRGKLEATGIDAKRIRVEGYADTQPLPEEELADLTADERRARHRRVIVRVY
jgi:chemotaxis protein MotB